MDASLDFAADVPWFLSYAAEPFELLRVIHPFLNASTLPPPANPIRLARHYFHKRDSCPTEKKSNSGVLIGAVVGSIVGTLLLAVLAFWLYRRSQGKKLQNAHNNPSNTNLNTPFKEAPAMPTPFLVPGHPGHPGVGGGTPPPAMKGASPYDMPGLNYTPATYPGAPSAGTGSSYGGQNEASYYNYAPPPPSSPQPTLSSGMGVGYYSATPAPPFMAHPSSTPPPPSTTPGATSTHSGTSSSAYQPWAVPMGMDSSSQGGSSSNMPPGVFASATEEKAQYHREEKAQYSRWPPAGSGSSSVTGSISRPEKAAPSGKPQPGDHTADVGPSADASGPSSGREGAMAPGVGITGGRDGALSPTPGLPPPAYSPE